MSSEPGTTPVGWWHRWCAHYGSWLDRVACHAGIWALRRLYGADCETDVRDDYPGENLVCFGCEAKRLVISMQEILQDG